MLMRRLVRLVLLLGLLGVPALGMAQTPTLVQISPYRLDGCSMTATATGAANTAVTATIPALSSKYFNVCTIHIVMVANAAVTGAAGPAPIFTTTNLPTNLVFWGDNGTLGTGAMKELAFQNYMPNGLKTALPGTAFTIVTSAGQSTQSVRINVAGWYSDD